MEVEMKGPGNGCAECGVPFQVPAGHLITCGITPSSPCTCGYESL